MLLGTSRICFRAGVRRMASEPGIRPLARPVGSAGGMPPVRGRGECAARHQSRSPVLVGGRWELLDTSDAWSHLRGDFPRVSIPVNLETLSLRAALPICRLSDL